MPAPSISIDETHVGTRPISLPALDVIGVVGTANWGPTDTPTLVTSLAEFMQQFGGYETGLTGILTASAVYAQNARARMYFVRATPSSVAGVKATKTLSAKVRIDAKHIGTEGNNVSVTVANGTHSGKKYTLSDAVLGLTEIWDDQGNTTVASNTFAAAGGPNEPGAGSQLVTFVSLVDTDPANAAAAPLVGGTNGTAVDADYIGAVGAGGSRTGLYAFDAVSDVRYLVAAQQSSTAIQTAWLAYAEARSIKQGLVFAIVNTPAAQDPGTVGIGTLDSDRAAIFWPWLQSVAMPVAARASYVAPDGFIAGLMSTQKPNRGPLNLPLYGVTQLQYSASDAQLDTVTDKRINPIVAPRGRGVRTWGNLTLSSDAAWSRIPIRQEYDAIEQAAWDGTAWVVGEPNDPDTLWPQVAGQMDAMLGQFVRDGTIVAFLPSVVDETNNTPQDVADGKLRIDLRIQPTFSVEYVLIRIDRVLDAGV